MARVLVVDDTESARTVLARLLRSDGFETATASNGSEAITAVEKSPPDLIILDLNMPQMDGLAVLQWLRDRPKHAAVAVVILSAAGAADMERARALGAKVCLSKAKASWPEIQREIRGHTS